MSQFFKKPGRWENKKINGNSEVDNLAEFSYQACQFIFGTKKMKCTSNCYSSSFASFIYLGECTPGRREEERRGKLRDTLMSDVGLQDRRRNKFVHVVKKQEAYRACSCCWTIPCTARRVARFKLSAIFIKRTFFPPY
jgi:hypothetical protein